MTPTLSLCITCCDLDAHLVENLLIEFSKQSVAPEEIIISSSGVPEESLNTTHTLIIAGHYVPVVYINQKFRVMQSVARNRGVSKSTQQLIMFFDVDDIPHPQKIEITKRIFKDNQIDALVHNYSTGPTVPFSTLNRYSLHRVLGKDPNPTSTNIVLEKDSPVHHAHVTTKTSIFEKIHFDESPRFFRREDGKFCQDLFDNDYKFFYTDLKLIHYT